MPVEKQRGNFPTQSFEQLDFKSGSTTGFT
jgi:hypothetical protein